MLKVRITYNITKKDKKDKDDKPFYFEIPDVAMFWCQGFPISAIEKYTELLLKNGYTGLVYDQVPSKSCKKRWSLAYIASPGLNNLLSYDDSNFRNYCISIFVIH